MKILISVHLAFGVALTALFAGIHGWNAAIGFATGASVSFLNVLILVSTWPRILAKKSVALSIGVIVFKFAILGWIIYEVVTEKPVHLGWFSAGLGLVVLSTLATSFAVTQNSHDHDKVET